MSWSKEEQKDIAKLNTEPGKINRRKFLENAALLTAAGMVMPGCLANAKTGSGASAIAGEKYKIGVCDWMILKRQKIGAFELTDKIGADGVEVDMGGLGDRKTFDSKLGDPETRQKFLDEAKKYNLKICSIAMSGFYAQSFSQRPTYMRMLKDTINTMTAMDVKVAFLPLGVQDNLVKNPELRPDVVKRLKKIAPIAEDAGVVIGLETHLDAAGEAALLDEVGSPAIKSYFNFSNPLQNGRNLYDELKTLGKDRICQIHCTDQDGVLLENNERLDMEKAKATLDEMGWKGWLVMERSRNEDKPHDTVYNFGNNAEYLKSIFQ